jgi:hypothetical protein
MERASTIHLYTSKPPLTCDGRIESQHVDTKGGNINFYNKLRNPGLELETLNSDTMLGIATYIIWGPKATIYSTSDLEYKDNNSRQIRTPRDLD